MDVILESVPINIPNAKKCRANHGLGTSVPREDGVFKRHIEQQKIELVKKQFKGPNKNDGS